MSCTLSNVCLAAILTMAASVPAHADEATLADAQRAFFNARYPAAADLALDLQAAVDACFALVGYERLLDYTQPPPPPDFNADDAAWIQARLTAVLTR